MNSEHGISAGQLVVATSVITLAAAVAVKVGTSYVWHSIQDGFEGSWDDMYDVADDDDEDDDVDPGVGRLAGQPLTAEDDDPNWDMYEEVQGW